MTKESSVFFPEEMRFVKLITPNESIYELVKVMSMESLIHLVDVNTDQRTQEKRYTDDFMRCEDADRSLRYIQTQLETYDCLLEKPDLGQFEQEAEQNVQGYRQLLPEIEDVDTRLRERIHSTQQLEVQNRDLKAAIETLQFYRPHLREHAMDHGSASDCGEHPLDMGLLDTGSRRFLFAVSGVVPATNLRRMFMAMYRVSRGNVVMSRGTDESGKKGYFTVFFQSETLEKKLLHIALSYGANVFEFPTDEGELENKEEELLSQLNEVEDILKRSYADNQHFLDEVKGKFWFWRIMFAREALIIKHMDYADFAVVEDCAVYSGWIPLRKLDELEPALQRAQTASGSARRITSDIQEGTEAPPTWIETNSFTAPFQMLCDAYGFADYDEVNAGAFYGMYPFLFGIMFGDIGHSMIFLTMSIGLIIASMRVKKGSGGLLETVAGFKWFFLALSLCGLYNGIIYNECFGLPINVFGSRYALDVNGTYYKKDASVYPIGLDPVWMFKDNELIYTNSLKMKISVVLGITMMVFGMFLQLIKQLRRKAWINLFLGWVPQMMYLCSFFAYMVALIIKKWCTPNDGTGVNIIQVLISMMLSPTDLPEDQKLYDGQQTVQNVIALTFVLSIPLMLIVKPIVEIRVHGVEGSILEVFVITLIEVIEFTLSALSHTASFLRLWALSLAHSQLSHVLYEQLFTLTLGLGPIPFFIGFAAWACGSVAILLGMESFSSLLHGIRLMWVEFSSKFFSGTGYDFRPLSFGREFELIQAKIVE